MTCTGAYTQLTFRLLDYLIMRFINRLTTTTTTTPRAWRVCFV